MFVRTRHVYESYADLWRLVELSGFPTCYVDEIDSASDTTYILVTRNGEMGNGWPDARARIIEWLMEWDAYPPLAGVRETWHLDKWMAGCIGAKYVPVGGHPDLRDPDPLRGTTYDAAYLAYMTSRRGRIQYELRISGVAVSPSSAWGWERHGILSNSRAYVHVHQREDAPGVPGLRMVVAAAYQLPVISEKVADRGIFGYSGMMDADYRYLSQFITQHVRDPHQQGLANYGHALYSLLCEQHTFRRVVENAL